MAKYVKPTLRVIKLERGTVLTESDFEMQGNEVEVIEDEQLDTDEWMNQ